MSKFIYTTKCKQTKNVYGIREINDNEYYAFCDKDFSIKKLIGDKNNKDIFISKMNKICKEDIYSESEFIKDFLLDISSVLYELL